MSVCRLSDVRPYVSSILLLVSFSHHSLTGVCVTTSLFRFPGLFRVFLPISTMLWFEWSRIFSEFQFQIQFLSWGFSFLAMSRFCRAQSRQFVTWNIYTVVFLTRFCCFTLFSYVAIAVVLYLSLLSFVHFSSSYIDALRQSSMLVIPLSPFRD